MAISSPTRVPSGVGVDCVTSTPLLFSPGGVDTNATPSKGTLLSQAALDSTTGAAVQRWEAAGLTKEQIATLRSLSFEVADLPSLKLGEADGNHIRVSRNAGGNGWFIDAGGLSDALFSVDATPSSRRFHNRARRGAASTSLYRSDERAGRPRRSADRDHARDGSCPGSAR